MTVKVGAPLLWHVRAIQIITDKQPHEQTGCYVRSSWTFSTVPPTRGARGTETIDALAHAGLKTDGTIGAKSLAASDGAGGPVESLRPTAGTPEILRTQRLNAKEEAEAILPTVTRGGTYSVDLTKASAIVVPGQATDTSKPAAP